MALTLGVPLVQGEGSSRGRTVGKVVLSFFIGLACAAFWAHGGYAQQGVAVDMAAMPSQQVYDTILYAGCRW